MPSPHTITTVDILRHGRTMADDILRGRTDTPLSPDGFQHMQNQLTKFVDDHKRTPWQQVISSPLQRCLKFADYVHTQYGIQVTANDDFIEMDYGDWDGETFDVIRARDAELFANVWQSPHQYSPPNGETFQDFTSRIDSAWHKLIRQHRGNHVLLICHGGVIKSLLGAILQAPLSSHARVEVPYACLSRIQIHHLEDNADWPQLVFHNFR